MASTRCTPRWPTSRSLPLPDNAGAEPAGGRAQPFYCPYCGEQDFVPIDDPGQFYCQSCNRRFQVKMLGLGYQI